MIEPGGKSDEGFRALEMEINVRSRDSTPERVRDMLIEPERRKV